MTKAELVEKVAAVEGMPSKKAANAAVDAVFAAIKESLVKGESFTFQGFGTFKTQTYAARTGVNLQTGQKIQIPQTKRPKFTPSQALKDAVK
ncbi:HU family DNA-binding protein [candidate division KSB1 bacterium]|nr:HU family DNA-binding protein [candidate division KSB1 bacterium]